MKFQTKYKKNKLLLTTWYDNRSRIIWSVQVEQDSQECTSMWDTFTKLCNVLNKMSEPQQRLFMKRGERHDLRVKYEGSIKALTSMPVS